VRAWLVWGFGIADRGAAVVPLTMWGRSLAVTGARRQGAVAARTVLLRIFEF
jgi:hypothetical protein